MMTISDFTPLLETTHRNGRGYVARCPAHDDRSPSLHISEGDDGRILIHCFSGCTTEEIVDSVGLRLSDLFEGNQSRESQGYHKKIREKSGVISKAEFSKASVFRRAETVLKATQGIDLSACSEDELDQAIDIAGAAILILNEETRYGQQII